MFASNYPVDKADDVDPAQLFVRVAVRDACNGAYRSVSKIALTVFKFLDRYSRTLPCD